MSLSELNELRLNMINAKKELEDLLANNKLELFAADINLYEHCEKVARLRTGYSKDDYDDFLSDLNFYYDNGFGAQELYGYLWFKDGTWAERYEYDGAEIWHIKVMPTLPDYLK